MLPLYETLYETRYIQEKCEEKTHRRIRVKTVSGKRSVYCVTLCDSCITANGGETDLDEKHILQIGGRELFWQDLVKVTG